MICVNQRVVAVKGPDGRRGSCVGSTLIEAWGSNFKATGDLGRDGFFLFCVKGNELENAGAHGLLKDIDLAWQGLGQEMPNDVVCRLLHHVSQELEILGLVQFAEYGDELRFVHAGPEV